MPLARNGLSKLRNNSNPYYFPFSTPFCTASSASASSYLDHKGFSELSTCRSRSRSVCARQRNHGWLVVNILRLLLVITVHLNVASSNEKILYPRLAGPWATPNLTVLCCTPLFRPMLPWTASMWWTHAQGTWNSQVQLHYSLSRQPNNQNRNGARTRNSDTPQMPLVQDISPFLIPRMLYMKSTCKQTWIDLSSSCRSLLIIFICLYRIRVILFLLAVHIHTFLLMAEFRTMSYADVSSFVSVISKITATRRTMPAGKVGSSWQDSNAPLPRPKALTTSVRPPLALVPLWGTRSPSPGWVYRWACSQLWRKYADVLGTWRTNPFCFSDESMLFCSVQIV